MPLSGDLFFLRIKNAEYDDAELRYPLISPLVQAFNVPIVIYSYVSLAAWFNYTAYFCVIIKLMDVTGYASV